MHHTTWLASYPKSGNTWFRIFIANLLNPEQGPASLNRLGVPTPIASSRLHFDELLGIPSSLLRPAEIESLRPVADQALRSDWEEPLLLRKVHDAYRWLPTGQPMLGQSPEFAALYILRDPWDVAVSMTNHFSCSLEQAVDHLCNPEFAVAHGDKGLSNQLAQRLLAWDAHVLSWLEAPLDLHLLRYEDMRQAPLATFRGAVRFLGLTADDQVIQAALDACRFERLQQQEQEARFRETPSKAPRFFRKGLVGEGLSLLNHEAMDRLMAMKQRVDAALVERGFIL
jgi:hypothetical protein